MTHFLAMLQKKAKDIDGQLHHSQHGQYQDKRLPHRREDDNSGGGDKE